MLNHMHDKFNSNSGRPLVPLPAPPSGETTRPTASRDAQGDAVAGNGPAPRGTEAQSSSSRSRLHSSDREVDECSGEIC